MIASCKRRDDLLAEYITLTECSYMGVRYVRLNLHLARLFALKPKEAT